METEKHTASENMKKFFDKLTELKKFIKEKAEETKDETVVEIHNRFDEIFKVEEGK